MNKTKKNMNKTKKNEKANKPRNVVSITLNEKMRRQLEEERERRGGDEAGVKLAPIAREILARQLDCETKSSGGRCEK